MAYVVQGTSAGGTTVVERETAQAAYDTAREMQRARYAGITINGPGGEPASLIGEPGARPGRLPVAAALPRRS